MQHFVLDIDSRTQFTQFWNGIFQSGRAYAERVEGPITSFTIGATRFVYDECFGDMTVTDENTFTAAVYFGSFADEVKLHIDTFLVLSTTPVERKLIKLFEDME